MKKETKKGGLLILGLLLILGATGCATAEDLALRQSGITEDKDYMQYERWKSEGKLEQDGSYSLATDDTERPQDSIRVTFAENPNMDIHYYYDAELTRSIDLNACYVMPGDFLYSSVPEPVSSITTYRFDRFNIYTWSGKERNLLDWKTSVEAEGLALQIPSDYSGTELSIEPVGAVENRLLLLQDYSDSAINRQELDGTWIVNEQTTTKRSIEVNPVEPLKVEYQYDAEKYVFVSSEPDSYYHDNGIVRFETISANEQVEGFSVQLRSIEDELFLFEPDRYKFDHGTVTFSYYGRVITEPRELRDGVSLDYRVSNIDSGYYSPKPNGSITINAADPDVTDDDIRRIQINSVEPVLVRLPQPKAGGLIQYFVDGREIEQDVCEVPPGSTITMKFINWNGWISEYKDGETYEVKEDEEQILNIEPTFRESEDHKPELSVILKDGLPSGTVLDIDVVNAAAQTGTDEPEVKITDLTYQNGSKTSKLPDWIGQNARCIFQNKIGTEEGITLTVRNDTLVSGTALRLDIKMTDDHKKESSFVRYLTKLPCDEHIEIYPDPAQDTTVYTSISIVVSKVEVVPYEQQTISHGVVEVSLVDDTAAQVLKEGDVLEDSQKVRVTIRSDSGYYVSGNKVTAAGYSDTMKYEKWRSDHVKIMEKHPIQKLLTITLDTNDSYGDCVYRLDGAVVSGAVKVKAEQKLTLEYTLTDSNYRFSRSGIGGFISGVFSQNQESTAIELSEDMDGKSIRRSDYIQIEKKEG